jgi:hypothetical protein
MTRGAAPTANDGPFTHLLKRGHQINARGRSARGARGDSESLLTLACWLFNLEGEKGHDLGSPWEDCGDAW